MANVTGIMALMGVLLLGISLLVGGIMPWLLFYIIVLLIIVPMGHSYLGWKSLKGKIELPREALYIGESVLVKYWIRNEGFFHIPFIRIQSRVSERLTGERLPVEMIGLKSKDSYYKSEKIVLKRRGYYELGDIKITVSDVFGLFSYVKIIESMASLVVYPEVINLTTFDIAISAQMGELGIKDPMFLDKSRVSSLRAYQEGDTIKRIHWKLSAKKEDLIVKNFDNRGDSHVVVVIDNDKKLFTNDVDRHLEDKSVEIALSLIAYCLNHQIDVQLLTQSGDNIVIVNGLLKSDLKPFLEKMAFFKGDGKRQFRDFMSPHIETITKGTTVVIVSSNLDRTMGAVALRLKIKHLNPILMLVSDIGYHAPQIFPDVEKKLGMEGIRIYRIDCKSSTKEVLERYER
ncbi:MAG: DUF58 domain-containing protein [Tissierellales bacterium]|nr:DUF58 domain-containing protein [Tissierellales bacterium]MBN2826630.1 DUF58 domain-containing protein [Tissierellales bacterium]